MILERLAPDLNTQLVPPKAGASNLDQGRLRTGQLRTANSTVLHLTHKGEIKRWTEHLQKLLTIEQQKGSYT